MAHSINRCLLFFLPWRSLNEYFAYDTNCGGQPMNESIVYLPNHHWPWRDGRLGCLKGTRTASLASRCTKLLALPLTAPQGAPLHWTCCIYKATFLPTKRRTWFDSFLFSFPPAGCKATFLLLSWYFSGCLRLPYICPQRASQVNFSDFIMYSFGGIFVLDEGKQYAVHRWQIVHLNALQSQPSGPNAGVKEGVELDITQN